MAWALALLWVFSVPVSLEAKLSGSCAQKGQTAVLIVNVKDLAGRSTFDTAMFSYVHLSWLESVVVTRQYGNWWQFEVYGHAPGYTVLTVHVHMLERGWYLRGELAVAVLERY